MKVARGVLAAVALVILLSACRQFFPFLAPDDSSAPIVTPAAGEATAQPTLRETIPQPASENPIPSPTIEVPPPIY